MVVGSIIGFLLGIGIIVTLGAITAKVVTFFLGISLLPNSVIPPVVTRPAVWIGAYGLGAIGIDALTGIVIVLFALLLDVRAVANAGGTRVGKKTGLVIADGLRRLDALLTTYADVELDRLDTYATRLETSVQRVEQPAEPESQ